MLLRVVTNLLHQDWNYLLLSLNVTAKDVQAIGKDVAKLIGISLIQQEFDTLQLSQVFLDSKLFDFFFWL